jgi:hypothetical protein
MHAFAVLWQIRTLPRPPVTGDEIVINDPAIALSRGQGLVAASFRDSARDIDKLYAHFPPLFIYVQSIVFRAFGVTALSLRLLTVSMSIAAVAVFLFIMHRLIQRGLVRRGTGLLLSCVYAFHAPNIVLHRMSRMESLVEFLSLTSLCCVVFAGLDEDTDARRGTRVLSTAAGGIFAGLALLAHPEALVAILPTLVLIAIAVRIPLVVRFATLAVTVALPFAVWWLVYGARSYIAFRQMTVIATQDAPGPMVVRFGLYLLNNARSNSHNMIALMSFGVGLVVLLLVIGWGIAGLRSLAAQRRSAWPPVLLLQGGFGIAGLMALGLLVWVVPSSITRYEVLLPVYLVGLAFPMRMGGWRRFGRVATWAVIGLLFVDAVAVAGYLARGIRTKDNSAAVYDAVLDCVPPGANLAASLQLWLALEERNRPFTVLHAQFDGFPRWRAQPGNPLDRFDVILLDDELKQQLGQYQPYSIPGRYVKEFHTNFSTIYDYSKQPIPANCDAKP